MQLRLTSSSYTAWRCCIGLKKKKMETLRRISLQNYKAWFTKPRKTGEHRVCVSPLSSQRHKCQRGRPGCCANLNARIVIPLAGSARDWLNLHLSPQRKEGQNCCRCFLFLFFFFSPTTTTTTHRSLKPFSSGYFWTTTICLGKCPEEGGALPKKEQSGWWGGSFF